jgi:hypothetical protein
MNRSSLLVALTAIATFASSNAWACPNCYGDPASPMTEGLSMAIISLLGVTGGVLTAFAAFFLYLRKRIGSRVDDAHRMNTH